MRRPSTHHRNSSKTPPFLQHRLQLRMTSPRGQQRARGPSFPPVLLARQSPSACSDPSRRRRPLRLPNGLHPRFPPPPRLRRPSCPPRRDSLRSCLAIPKVGPSCRACLRRGRVRITKRTTTTPLRNGFGVVVARRAALAATAAAAVPLGSLNNKIETRFRLTRTRPRRIAASMDVDVDAGVVRLRAEVALPGVVDAASSPPVRLGRSTLATPTCPSILCTASRPRLLLLPNRHRRHHRIGRSIRLRISVPR